MASLRHPIWPASYYGGFPERPLAVFDVLHHIALLAAFLLFAAAAGMVVRHAHAGRRMLGATAVALALLVALGTLKRFGVSAAFEFGYRIGGQGFNTSRFGIVGLSVDHVGIFLLQASLPLAALLLLRATVGRLNAAAVSEARIRTTFIWLALLACGALAADELERLPGSSGLTSPRVFRIDSFLSINDHVEEVTAVVDLLVFPLLAVSAAAALRGARGVQWLLGACQFAILLASIRLFQIVSSMLIEFAGLTVERFSNWRSPLETLRALSWAASHFAWQCAIPALVLVVLRRSADAGATAGAGAAPAAPSAPPFASEVPSR